MGDPGAGRVALTGGPEGDTIVRRAARIAARSAGGDLLAVHVTRSDGLAAGASHASLARQRRPVEDLGGSYHQVVGGDVASTLVEFARAENATQLVLGASRRGRLERFVTGLGTGSPSSRSPATSTYTASPTNGSAAAPCCRPAAVRSPGPA